MVSVIGEAFLFRKEVFQDSASPPSMKVRANTILSSSSLILFRMKCSWMVSMNFSRVSCFPAKGVIFPPLMSGVQTAGVGLGSISIAGIIGGVCWFLLLRSAANSCLVGSGSSGGVPKADSVGVSGVRGSGVAGLLHRCLRLNGSKGPVCSMVGSPPRELLVSSCPSSESGSLGGRILHPLRVVVFSCLGGLASKDGARLSAAKLVLRLEESRDDWSTFLQDSRSLTLARSFLDGSFFRLSGGLDVALFGRRAMRSEQVYFQQSLAGEIRLLYNPFLY